MIEYMGLFNRNKNSGKLCNHKWKDFNWYIDATYFPEDNNRLEIKVVEPYVCIFCKQRKDVILTNYNTIVDSQSNAVKICDKLKEQYKGKISDRAFVEDEINDMILVDREYLDLYEQITHTKA